MYAILKKLFRDNILINPVFRNVIRIGQGHFKWFNNLANQYRVYGIIQLKICDIRIKAITHGDDFIVNELYYQLGYESNEFRLVKILIKNSNYFIDVGANTGIFSVFAASIRDSIRVLSFEPHPGNFKRLIENININRLSNVEAFPTALGSKLSTIEFTVPSDLSIAATASANREFTMNFHQIDHLSVMVEQVSLNTALMSIPLSTWDILKIDVEYYELEVLKGAEVILRNFRPLLLLEVLQYENLVKQFPQMIGKIDKNHANEIFFLLANLGYFAYEIGADVLLFTESLKGHENRNFLFVPKKLPRDTYYFEEILSALEAE